MECFVLGTGGMMPMPYRRLSSVAIRTQGLIYLFDCGEGTQVPYKEKHLGLRNLNLIAISHLHADHVLGLPGMLMLRAQMPDPGPLTIVGPPGLGRFVRHVRSDLRMHVQYPVQIIEWQEGGDELAYRDDQIKLFWHPLAHSVLCLGYRLEEHDRPGRFDPDAARRLGVPHGPLYGQLQSGKSVTTPDGREVLPSQVLGPTRRGRHVAFVTDTSVTPSIGQLMHRVDVGFVEAMFLPEHLEDARQKRHMTVEQSVTAAQQAGAERVVLLHISPRYEKREIRRYNELAQAIHPNARVGKEGQVIKVALPE